MEKEKNDRILVIVSLIVAIITLTVGFAAFSNTLIISSGATVTPDAADFDINVYGISSRDSYDGDLMNLNLYDSPTFSKPIPFTSEVATDAKISDNGKNVTISDLSVQLKKPGDGVQYIFLVKNEGQYDAYLTSDSLIKLFNEGIDHTCVAGPDATGDLVDRACDYISFAGYAIDSDFNDNLSDLMNYGSYKFSKGGYFFLQLDIYYENVDGVVRADGDFSVDFDDIVLDFSSVPPEE